LFHKKLGPGTSRTGTGNPMDFFGQQYQGRRNVITIGGAQHKRGAIRKYSRYQQIVSTNL